jgi:hypothetical protein
MTRWAGSKAKARAVIGGFGFLLAGCGPSSATLRNVSSGDLPCGQADIGVYGRTTKDHVDEWTATCKGQLYTCTRPSGGGDADCTPQGTRSDNVTTPTPPSAPPPPETAPQGAAGFSFGASPQDAQKVCEAADQTWSQSGKEWACSGAPKSVGFDAAVNVRICSGQVCAISLIHSPKEDWAAFIADTKDRLVEKYGPPTESDDLVPRLCRPRQEFVACIDRAELKLRFTWAWPTGERVALVVGRFLGEPSTVRIEYGRIRSAL